MRLRAAVAASVCLALLGCAPGLEREPDPGSTAPQHQDEGDDADPVTLPPEFLECDPRREVGDVLALTSDDLTQVRWDVPEGFAQSQDFHEAHPPADQVLFWVAEPQPPNPPDAVAVAVHAGVDWRGVADACLTIPQEAARQWLAEYHEGLDLELLGEPEEITLGGYPAIQQLRRYVDRTSLAAWVFSQDHVLVVYCQWETEASAEAVRSGCEDLRESIVVT